MKLVNTTPYDSKDLKDFIYVCGKKLRGGRKITKELLVITKARYSGNGISGLGWLQKVWVRKHGHQGYLIKLKIPVNLGQMPVEKFKRDLAHVVIHELMHCQGSNHWKIHKLEKKYGYTWGAETLSFADNLPLGLKTQTSKPQRDIRSERYVQAKKKVVEMTSKVKRYENLLKKWRKKVKYYEN